MTRRVQSAKPYLPAPLYKSGPAAIVSALRSNDPITSLDTETLQAYGETEYHVLTKPGFTLHVGILSMPLLLAHRRHGVTCSAFLTACNPLSQLLSAAENQRRMKALRAELAQRSLTFDEGLGEHPTNGWPAEASVLVYGLALQAARSLATRWQQNAIVWCGPDAVPQLVLLQ